MAWNPAAGPILTRWAGDVSPDNAWPEYPRPQMRRTEWLSLNGLWDYAITPRRAVPVDYEGQILVPFAVESALSGVGRPLAPNERLWYRRRFGVPARWQGRRVLLHFGAVDWEATVWVNGQEVGTHRGGYVPFYFDITECLLPSAGTGAGGDGANELVVAVWDPTDRHWQQRGKQALAPSGIWYSAVSGIWQTVWLEPVPEPYIRGLRLTPDVGAGTLSVEVDLAGEVERAGLRVMAHAAGAEIAAGLGQAGQPIALTIPQPRLWSPEDPFLYDLVVEVERKGQAIDRVESTFGMRRFGLGRDRQGRTRLCLNGRPLFQFGPLDQGYWPDGLYTAPSEAALRADLEYVKSIGCNMLRKHVKVESARFYHECDRLGLIVWQDMPNGGRAVGAALSLLATLSGRLRRRDTRFHRRAGRESVESRQDYWRELREMVEHLRNFACIGAWVPFNEGWGQFDSREVARWLRGYDPMRPVDHASGWFDQGGGEMRSLHVYFKALPGEEPEAGRAVVLSEFGGYAIKLAGHAWKPDSSFGYRKFDTPEALTGAYLDLLETQLKPWIRRGLSAAVYTQLTDVETETNGYLTYDRAVGKMDAARIAEAHRSLYALQGG